MGLADLFRPNWKHSKPSIREDAVRDLDPEDDGALLEEIARTDADAVVRKTAIAKLGDADMLSSIADNESDDEVRKVAAARASRLWVARADEAEDPQAAIAAIAHITDQGALTALVTRTRIAEVRRAALSQLTDERALAEVARASIDTASRVEAIRKISDSALLHALAVDSNRKDVGFAAVDRLTDPEALATVANKGKLKAVRARAKKKATVLAPPKETSSAEKTRHAEEVQQLRELDELVRSAGWKRGETLDRCRAKWAELAPHNEDHQSRFDTACRRFEIAAEQYAEQMAKLEASRPRLVQPAPEPAPEPTPKPTEDDESARDDEPSSPQEAGTAAEPASDEQAPPVGSEESAEEAAARAAAAEERAREREEKKRRREEERAENEHTFRAICDELDELSESTSFRKIENALTRSRREVDDLGELPTRKDKNELRERFDAIRSKLVARIRELRDADEWKRWANIPKQEQLIERAKALLADDEEQDLGAALKKLQIDWKQVGAAQRGKGDELWKSFKDICDQIYARSQEQQQQRKEERKENLNRKRDLCERVEALVESTDWEETANEIKQLQAEWRRVGPVPRRHSQKIWKRFRSACDQFFERRKPHLDEQMESRRENLARKESLCATVEELATGLTLECDWTEAYETAKQLQRDWREIGPTPRKEGDQAYKRFRAACDRVFARREELERERAAEERAQRERELIEIAAAASSSDAEQLVSAWGKAIALAASETSPVRSAGEAHLYDAIERIGADDPAAFTDTELDPQSCKQRKEKLCARVEALIPPEPGSEPASVASAEAMAQRLRSALAENALGGVFRDEDRDLPGEVARARTGWRRIGPAGADEKALAERFSAACEAAVPGSTADPEPVPVPEPTAAEPEAVAAEPEAVAAEPEAVAAEPEADAEEQGPALPPQTDEADEADEVDEGWEL